KREAIAYLQGAAICHAVKPEPEKPAQAQAIPCNSDRKELISSRKHCTTDDARLTECKPGISCRGNACDRWRQSEDELGKGYCASRLNLSEFPLVLD
ncbi:MAG: hypothetical protein AB1611_17415, partial [bacterium]